MRYTRLIASISIVSCHMVSGISEKSDSLTNSYLLNDSVYTITNERFSIYLKGIYAIDMSYNDRGSSSYRYNSNHREHYISNYYGLDEITIYRQDPFNIEWNCSDVGDARSKLSNRQLINKNSVKKFAGLDSVEWFQLEFLRGKLLTINISNTLDSKDFLFTGLQRLRESSFMGSQGLEIQFTADDQSIYGLKVMTDKNGDASLILSPNELERLGLGGLSRSLEGSFYYSNNSTSYQRFDAYDIKRFLEATSSSSDYNYQSYVEMFYFQRYVREQTYWSIWRNSGPGFESYYLNPVALVFGIERI